MEPDELAAYIRSEVDLAPALTADQRSHLASLLHRGVEDHGLDAPHQLAIAPTEP